MIVQIPHNFSPRDYQKPLYNALPAGFTRGVVVWHRRAGKDKTFINIMAREALKRVGSYFYILPYYVQARRIVWEGLDGAGFRNIDHFHPQLVKRRDNQQMTLELKNGSFIRFLGSDNIDSIVGTNPVGVVFSEFSLHKIEAWTYLRPILLENGGWALFNGTPRGKNHLYDMYNRAQNDPKWFTQLLTIDDTGVMTKEQVDEEVSNGMPLAIAKQEFYCSFDAAMVGAYYAYQIERIEEDKRFTSVPWDENTAVHTAWDLGMHDTTTIWFFQVVGKEIRYIDTISDSGHGLARYVKEMKDKPYTYGFHALPHDVMVRELGSGKSRKATLTELGLKDIRVAPRASVEDGINHVRASLGSSWFDRAKCARGFEALKQYRATWDQDKQVYGSPIHDWSSHFADAIRTGAMVLNTSDSNTRLSAASGTFYDPLRVDDAGYREQLETEAYYG